MPGKPAEPAGDRDDAKAEILRRELRSHGTWRRVMALKRDCRRPRLSSETGQDERGTAMKHVAQTHGVMAFVQKLAAARQVGFQASTDCGVVFSWCVG
jgi:hypothetical protein